MLRAIATILLLAVTAETTFPAVAAAQAATEAVYDAPAAPPEKSSALVWKHGDLSAHGFWYTDEQVVKIAGRVTKAEAERDAAVNAAAQAKVEAAEAKGQASIPTWVWILASVSAGIAAGYFGKQYLDGRSSTSSTTAPPTATTPAALRF